MKKFAKILSSALCAVLCIIVLAGCGGKAQLDTEASVSKKGLKSSTTQELETFLDEKTGESELSIENLASYRYTLKSKDSDGEMTINAIVIIDLEKQEVSELAMKYYLKADTMGTQDYAIYIKDSVMYMSGDLEIAGTKSSFKYKMTLTDEEGVEPTAENGEDTDYASMFAGILNMLDQMDVSGLVKTIYGLPGMYEDYLENVKITKYTKGDVTRFGIEYVDNNEETTKWYFEVTGNNITALQMEEYSETSEYFSAISKFDGKINYPKFKDYTDLDTLLSGITQ